METITDKILNDDFLWDSMLNHINSRKKVTRKGFLNICCPVCTSMGEKSLDTRFRCGIKQNHPGFGISCFNCGFKTKWYPGMTIGKKLKTFFECIGMDDNEIKQLNHKALRYRNSLGPMTETYQTQIVSPFLPVFDCIKLPEGSKTISQWVSEDCLDKNFLEVIQYLYGNRGIAIAESYEYYWSPDEKFNRRLIIPMYYHHSIVGYTARTIDPARKIKYYMESPENYLFNANAMEKDRDYIILIEGPFDAIAIDGVGLLGSNLNDLQTSWINSFGKKVILVPDRDTKGQKTIDIALKNKWYVSFPSLRSGSVGKNFWEDHIKDAADAVKNYGKIWTLVSIIESATKNPMEINVKRKMLI